MPLARDTIFRIYSMGKPVTSAAMMILHEQGKFQLTDPVKLYLPLLDKKNLRVAVGGDRWARAALTLTLDCLRLSSIGIPGFSTNQGG